MVHAKEFIGDYSMKRTREVMKLSRQQVRILIAFLTGHCRARYHLKKMGIGTDVICRMCGEEEETAKHILCDCSSLENRRHRTFDDRAGTVTSEYIWRQRLGTVYSFLKDIKIVKEEYLR